VERSGAGVSELGQLIRPQERAVFLARREMAIPYPRPALRQAFILFCDLNSFSKHQ
jgi:hypothetical protein